MKDHRFTLADKPRPKRVLGKSLQLLVITTLLVGLAVSVRSVQVANSTYQAVGPGETPPNFKVGFIGDQGLEAASRAVLQLIRDEGADMVLHQGDFEYADNPDAWDAQINDILGSSFPYFASVGNHDVAQWGGYQQKLLDRLSRIPGAVCYGEYGVNAACTYQGLFFILSGVGTLGSGHATFIRDQLAQSDSIWRVCTWHKNQNAMQVGLKSDAVGWEVYEECRKGDALVATGHEHSYERTKTLINIQSQTVDPLWPNPDMLRVGGGSTFVFVSGLGGYTISNQDRCLPTSPPYGCNGEWARISTSDQGANHGALFIEFNVDGDPKKAHGYFKNIAGEIIDSFTVNADPDITASVGGTAELPLVAETSVDRTDSWMDPPARMYGTLAGGLAAAAMAVALAAWYARKRWLR